MKPSEENNHVLEFDVVVIGGGPGGVSAALTCARHGAKTALIQNRPVFGGNNSSEIRMHISGADQHAMRKNARESGIVEEIALKNRKFNPQNSFCVSDMVYWDLCSSQENLTPYLNTQVTDVIMRNETQIREVTAHQLTTEKIFRFRADIFVDATGDGFIAAEAGADIMYGREAKETFNEPNALDKADDYTMGNSIMFTTMDMHRPVPFVKPKWAYTYTEQDLVNRPHSDGTQYWRAKAGLDSGYWWIELGGQDLSTISDSEAIRDELYKVLYGVWDHMKNGGNHGADNLALDWVASLPGKRESRRIMGDHVLSELDLMECRHFPDAVAYGGWTLDQHNIGGMKNLTDPPAAYLNPPDVYQIPFRCYYSRNIDNLMMSGRNISCTHMAMSSSRVMGTCMVGGQAVGVGAAIAVREKITPRQVGQQFIQEIQQALLNDDCYIPYVKNTDPLDLAREAKVSVSSEQPGFEAQNILNGFHRSVHDDVNLWRSAPLSRGDAWISLSFGHAVEISKVILRFDSNLSDEIFVSINKAQLMDQATGVPVSLVRDYRLVFEKDGVAMKQLDVSDNYLRHVIHALDESVCCDTLRLQCLATNGSPCAGIFEIRAYA